mmetsp:Transcript_2828/g.8500  ORF Transcript_2828/g.8500 Transcript_2828/m.8500 type:complete len:232 (+) Transcript_2828:336-1031(+)
MCEVGGSKSIAHILKIQQSHVVSSDEHVRGLQIAVNQRAPLFHISTVVVGEGVRLPPSGHGRALDAAPDRFKIEVPRRRRGLEHAPEVVEQPRPRGLDSTLELLGVLIGGLPVAAAAPLFVRARPPRRLGKVRVEAGQRLQRRAQVVSREQVALPVAVVGREIPQEEQRRGVQGVVGRRVDRRGQHRRHLDANGGQSLRRVRREERRLDAEGCDISPQLLRLRRRLLHGCG